MVGRPGFARYPGAWQTRVGSLAPTAQKYGVSLQHKLHLAFLVRPAFRRTVKKHASCKVWPTARKPRKASPVGPKKSRCFFLRKSAVFQSLMRGTAKQHGLLHIGGHLVAKGVLRHMGQIHPIFTCMYRENRPIFSKYGVSRQPKLDTVQVVPTSPLGTSRTPWGHQPYISR